MAVESKKKIAVIGAGPAGLAAALTLAQAGCEVDLYESQAEVGGLSRTLDLWNHKVDLGPHRFFSPSDKVNALWFDLVGSKYSWVTRQTRIFYKKKYFNYPLQAINTFSQLGIGESFLCLFSYLRQQLRFTSKADAAVSFESWILSRFGKRLYQIFFRTYSEKLWGLPCDQIDSDFAYRKIKRLSFFEVLKKFFSYKKTHMEYFAYPHAGTGSVYNTMAERFSAAGGHLFLDTRVEKVELANPSLGTSPIRISSKHKTQVYEKVVSTMPLPQLVRILGAPDFVLQVARQLKFRNTILVYLLVEGKNHFKDNWIYVHSPEVDFGRVTNFSNWSPELNKEQPNTVLCLEYWCNEQDTQWISQDSALVDNATEGLQKSGIIKDVKIIAATVYRVPKSYPIFQLDYKKNLAVLNDHLAQFESIYSIGRNGSFSYNNQDHSILMGLEAAENIIKGLRHEVVKLPTVYEEDTEILRFAMVEEV